MYILIFLIELISDSNETYMLPMHYVDLFDVVSS